MLHRNQILISDCVRRSKRQGRGDNWAVQRAPHVDDAIAPLQQLLCFVAEMDLHALLRRGCSLVDMRYIDRAALSVLGRAADRVVEEDDLGGAGDVIQDQLLELGVVVLLDVGVVEEVLLGGLGHVLDDGEGVFVEVVGGLVPAHIVDRDVDAGLAEVSGRLACGRRLDPVEGHAPVGGRDKEVEGCGDGAPRDQGLGGAWEAGGFGAGGGGEVVSGCDLLL